MAAHPAPPPDDLYLMVLLWQLERTRDVALDLADRNRAVSVLRYAAKHDVIEWDDDKRSARP